MLQLIYASRPFGFDETALSGILLTARRANPLHDVTGALICRSDIYLQLLEGPDAAIHRLYQNICRDDRHLEVACLLERQVESRMFPGWAMRDDPAQSWLWTPDQIHDGALSRASSAELLAVFERLG